MTTARGGGIETMHPRRCVPAVQSVEEFSLCFSLFVLGFLPFDVETNFLFVQAHSADAIAT